MGLTLLRAAFALTVILVVTGCSGAGLQTREQQAGLKTSPTEAEVPAGVDPAVWAQLTTRLASELKAASAVAPPHLPPDELTTIDDLTVTPLADGYMLEWSYKNPGDYNQDGEVNLADLGILGRFLNTPQSSPEWPLARRADGNGDGAVNINDVSALAYNWRGSVGGYLIAPDLGDGNGDGFISNSDLSPFGRLLAGEENGVLVLHPRSGVDQGFPTYAGPEGDDLYTSVEPGTPGLPGAWIGGFLFQTSKAQIDENGRKRFSYHLEESVSNDFKDWTIGVVPAFDSGERYHEPQWSEDHVAVYWDWSTVGELSNLVTLPGILQ